MIRTSGKLVPQVGCRNVKEVNISSLAIMKSASHGDALSDHVFKEWREQYVLSCPVTQTISLLTFAEYT